MQAVEEQTAQEKIVAILNNGLQQKLDDRVVEQQLIAASEQDIRENGNAALKAQLNAEMDGAAMAIQTGKGKKDGFVAGLIQYYRGLAMSGGSADVAQVNALLMAASEAESADMAVDEGAKHEIVQKGNTNDAAPTERAMAAADAVLASLGPADQSHVDIIGRKPGGRSV